MTADTIDSDRIAALRKAMPQKAFDRSLAAFRTAIANRPRDFAAAVDQEQWDEARRIAHSIKGVCGNFGAQALASISERVEGLLTDGDHSAAAALAGELCETADRTVQALDRASGSGS